MRRYKLFWGEIGLLSTVYYYFVIGGPPYDRFSWLIFCKEFWPVAWPLQHHACTVPVLVDNLAGVCAVCRVKGS